MFLKRLSAFFLDILEVIVFSVAIFLFIYLLVLQPHKIRGGSMDPNYFDGEYLLTDKLSYRFREPKRGDVVVFKAPGTNGDEFIKRIIGLPNETIMLKNGLVYINDKLLKEDYIDESVFTAARSFLQENVAIMIPENNFIVFGDNRQNSSDSRVWGFVDKEKITGRAFIIYWPTSSMGLIKAVNYYI